MSAKLEKPLPLSAVLKAMYDDIIILGGFNIARDPSTGVYKAYFRLEEEEYDNNRRVDELTIIMTDSECHFLQVASLIASRKDTLTPDDQATANRWLEELKASYDTNMMEHVVRAIVSTPDSELAEHAKARLHPDFKRLYAAFQTKSTLLFPTDDGKLSGKKHPHSKDSQDATE